MVAPANRGERHERAEQRVLDEVLALIVTDEA